VPVLSESAEVFRNFTRLGDRPIAVLEHSLYRRVWAPSDLEEFARVVDHLAWQSPGGWRGQADIEWPLDSGAARRLGLRERGGVDYEAEVADYEQDLLHRTRMQGWGVHGGRELGDLELLARLQHHGAATRLMDFSRSVYVALWFASCEQPDQTGLLIGLDLVDAWRLQDPADLARPMAEVLGLSGDRLGIWHPSALSPRLPAQSGFFLWGKTQERPWGSIGAEPLLGADALPTSRQLPTFVCVAVTPALKASMDLQAKSMFGYSAETLFPDFDGFAAAHGVSVPTDA
jgi:hypothetical protein